jgi:integral membrane protein (TIGR01906 family)
VTTPGASTAGDRAGRVVRILVGILIPVVLVLTNVRMLLTHTFVRLEYATPGFPADPYGFTQQEREKWAGLALDYLLNDAGPSFLGDLRSAEGSPLYDARELRHMVDVKNLVAKASTAWWPCSLLLVIGLVLTWRLGGSSLLLASLNLGGRLTLILTTLLIGILVISFPFLFVGFHEIFFQGGTWTFFRSDTLIRLFPERFWRDAFGLLLLLTLAEGALMVVGTRRRTPGRARAGGEMPSGDASP